MAALVRVYADGVRHHAAIDPIVHHEPTEAHARARIEGKLADPEKELFAAELDGEVVGILELQRLKPPDPGSILRPIPSAQLGIAVREDRRGQGIGAALMAFAEDWARERDLAAITLDMSSANEAAGRFYERLGYRVYGLLMRKPLDEDGQSPGR